jgi:alkanesulfonate monooxygenase SsuD/methylene tetrahydromethanopterin reductase-like flavin-dependent oxidoreductase (luciferase family)
MATTLDHVSGGRAYLGIGSAWNDDEAHDFGFEFGASPGERLRWLGEALPIIRGMLRGEEPSASGPHHFADHVRNLPPPIPEHLPILVGGGGPKVTLRLVARYADANNVGGGFENVKRKERILREHCEAVGRDEREIERTAGIGRVLIRDSREEARRVMAGQMERNGRARSGADPAVGTPEDLVELMAPYAEIGYHHLIVDLVAPFDEETLVRLAREVQPKLRES